MSGCYSADLGMISHCTELCSLTQSRLCEIDKTISYLQENSSSLMNEDIEAFIEDLNESKEKILAKVRQISSDVNQTTGYNDVQNLIREAGSLLSEANDVSIIRMSAIKKMVQKSLESAIRENQEELAGASKGLARQRKDLPSFLESISDSEVRIAVRILSGNPEYNALSMNELKQLAEKKIQPEAAQSSENAHAIIEERISDMKINGVDDKIIESVVNASFSSKTLLDIINESDEAILSEKIRKKAIASIISNIADKGFIVDKKKIRLLRETNAVKITAMKPGGQIAEFHIHLDGSFIYKFDEYEGQACQKDIVSFIDDLNSIYGIKVGNIREKWLNPDKISKVNYQNSDVMKRG
ncbi:MAG: hypothetical protein LBU81_06225 [Methanosarcinales archaeon]|jgi:hypothetical protein|nr:hypothetical protein [Methanosarcinales archaeon]